MTRPLSPSTWAQALARAAENTANTSTDLPLAMTMRMSEASAAVRDRSARWARQNIGGLWSEVDPYDGDAVQEFTVEATRHMATAQSATARAAAAAQTQILSTMGVQVSVTPSDPVDVRGSSLTMSRNGIEVNASTSAVEYSNDDSVRIAASDMTTQAVLNRPARTYRFARSQRASDAEASAQAMRRLDTIIDTNLTLAQRIAETEVIAVAAAPTRRGEDPLDALERELAETPQRAFWTPTAERFADDEDAVPEPVDLDAPPPEGDVIGYRRIYHPELSRGGSCAMCIVAADRLYTIGTLKPIHAGCWCTIAPVTKDFDPGQILNSDEINRLYGDAGGTSRRHLKRTRYVVDENGELAAVLVPKAAYKPRDTDKTESRRTTTKRKTKADRTTPTHAGTTPPPPTEPPNTPPAAASPDEPRRGRVDRSQVKHVQQHELDTAERLADLGDDVTFLPATETSATPDVEVNGERWELKSPISVNRNTLTKRISDGFRQSSNVVFDLARTPISIDDARGVAEDAVRRYPGNRVRIVGRMTDDGGLLDLTIGGE